MHTEVRGDLLEGHAGITATSYANDVVAELTGIWLGHVDILSGRPPRQARSGVTRPRGSPKHLPKDLAGFGAFWVQRRAVMRRELEQLLSA